MPRQNFTTPVGRMVMGSLYKPQTKDAEGNLLTIKSGPNAGQPKVEYFFALAILKGGEGHWAHTEWGKIIWAVGHADFPSGQAQSPAFAWKVVDGDSQTPNRTGKKPCDREGYPGNWVLSFKSGFAPKIYNANGSQEISEPDAVKCGYYIQVNGDVEGNGSMQQPGVFLNHSIVALSAYGPEIHVGPDPSGVGFGNAPLPAGASLTPPASFVPPPATPSGIPGFPPPAMPGAPGIPPVAMMGLPSGPPAAPSMQNQAVLNVPASKQMLPKAGGAPYEQFRAQGWTDDLLRAHGYMA